MMSIFEHVELFLEIFNYLFAHTFILIINLLTLQSKRSFIDYGGLMQ